MKNLLLNQWKAKIFSLLVALGLWALIREHIRPLTPAQPTKFSVTETQSMTEFSAKAEEPISISIKPPVEGAAGEAEEEGDE